MTNQENGKQAPIRESRILTERVLTCGRIVMDGKAYSGCGGSVIATFPASWTLDRAKEVWRKTPHGQNHVGHHRWDSIELPIINPEEYIVEAVAEFQAEKPRRGRKPKTKDSSEDNE